MSIDFKEKLQNGASYTEIIQLNGMPVFPFQSQDFRNVSTAGAMVYHQVGVPTATTS